MNLIDDYEHKSADLMYVFENIPTGETKYMFEEEFCEGCDCERTCTESDCSCLKRSDAKYDFPKENQEKTTSYVIRNKGTGRPLFECNAKCQCFETVLKCGNRLAQLGPRRDLAIVNCGDQKGLGLKTAKKIDKGNFICEYAGEVISQAEATRRQEINKRNGSMNYIFCVNEYFGENCVTTYIDPSKFGNIGRYINHSCEPNCELIPVRVNTVVPKLCIFAKTNIEENCELTFDYGVNDSEHLDNVKLTECRCGMKNCRKFLPFNNKT